MLLTAPPFAIVIDSGDLKINHSHQHVSILGLVRRWETWERLNESLTQLVVSAQARSINTKTSPHIFYLTPASLQHFTKSSTIYQVFNTLPSLQHLTSNTLREYGRTIPVKPSGAFETVSWHIFPLLTVVLTCHSMNAQEPEVAGEENPLPKPEELMNR